MKRVVLLLVLMTTISACSVVAAGTGSPEPDFTRITVGTTRAIVEQELGSALSTEAEAGFQKSVYTYKLGDKPAAGRALGYLALDIITLAFAEYILFPLEISNSGNAYDAAVYYDSNDTVRRVEQKIPR